MPEDPDLLFRHLPADGSAVGNMKLRETLGWDEGRHASAKGVSISAVLLGFHDRRIPSSPNPSSHFSHPQP